MKKLIILASVLMSQTAFAQQIRVQKVKGNKAIVEFSGDLAPGRTYNLGGSSSSSANTSGSGRSYVIGGSFSYFSGTDSTSVSSISASNSTSSLNLTARFGWNFETYELGPLFSYQSTSAGSQTTSATSFGGFADYNLSPNRSGETTIFAGTGELTYGNLSQSSTSGSLMGFFLGGSVKWFGLTNSTALRADLGYDYRKTTIGSANVTTSGVALRAGISTYF